ncbi:MAG: hypothetical protein M1838_005844 [Thelocarpon superellum]|nr:MAG: hypothetical protein M1838_005844 [Thelocarpon superellum]
MGGQANQWGSGQPEQSSQMYQPAFGVAMGDGYANMGWNGQAGYDPMMQSMQIGMSNGQWGMFSNMMGMPGASIDTMAMAQGVYGGYEGPGMGMNGTSGMQGMGFGMGSGLNAGSQGGYDGWNNGIGLNAWKAGQDKFNPNAHANTAMAASGMGDFGTNTAFSPSAPVAANGGYNVPSHGEQGGMQMHLSPFPFGNGNNYRHQHANAFQGSHTTGPAQGFGPNHHARGGFGGGGGGHGRGGPHNHQITSSPRAPHVGGPTPLPGAHGVAGWQAFPEHQGTDAKTLTAEPGTEPKVGTGNAQPAPMDTGAGGPTADADHHGTDHALDLTRSQREGGPAGESFTSNSSLPQVRRRWRHEIPSLILLDVGEVAHEASLAVGPACEAVELVDGSALLE